MRPHQSLARGIDLPYRNVGALYMAKASAQPDKTFLVCPGRDEEAFTYREFGAFYLCAARHLIDLGLVTGDRFGLIAANSSEFLLFYFAGLAMGITVVPINPDLSPLEMQYIVEDSRAKVVLFQSDLKTKVDQLQAALAARNIINHFS